MNRTGVCRGTKTSL